MGLLSPIVAGYNMDMVMQNLEEIVIEKVICTLVGRLLFYFRYVDDIILFDII